MKRIILLLGLMQNCLPVIARNIENNEFLKLMRAYIRVNTINRIPVTIILKKSLLLLSYISIDHFNY